MYSYLKVGTIVNTHGIRGEVKILPSTDFADERFRVGNTLRIEQPGTGKFEDVTVKYARDQKTNYIVQFEGWTDINQVIPYKGWQILIPVKELSELPEGEFYIFQLVGCEVFMPDGSLLGKITQVLHPGANDVWEVQGEDPSGKKKLKSHYIPYIDDVVKKIDIGLRRIEIEPIEGLIE